MAGESGYTYQGKSFTVFKDGSKVGEWPSNSAESDSKSRKPSSSMKVTSETSVLVWEDDGLVRCYGWGYFDRDRDRVIPDTKAAPFCVKK
jgi:hypothetical protein